MASDPWVVFLFLSLLFLYSSVALFPRVGSLLSWCQHLAPEQGPWPSIFLNIRVFSSELTLHIRWPKYWSFSISPSNEEQQKEFLRVGELRRLLFHLIFSFVPLPASKQYGYRSTVMTLVSRQVPKTQGGNPSCAQKSVLQEHFFSPCLPLLHSPVSRWRYWKPVAEQGNRSPRFLPRGPGRET